MLYPALVAAALSLPCLGFAFLWDDYAFLANALSGNLKDWLPRVEEPFYRPISRALYFGIIAPFGSSGAMLAHLLNLAYLAAAVILFTLLATRLRSRSFGLLAGSLFAGMAAIPTLVGWASCSQDLLAINFVLIALLLRDQGRDSLSFLAFAAALFSKETALTAVPALVAWRWITDQRPYRMKQSAIPHLVLICAWAAIHPAVRILLARGFAPGATGYVGLTEPSKWALFATKYAAVMTNLRLGPFEPTWATGTTVYLGIVALAAAGIFRLVQAKVAEDEPAQGPRLPDAKVFTLALLLSVPALLMTSTIINSWSPYYAAFPMVGVALVFALGLERLPRRSLAAVLGIYLLLGIWARGSNVDTVHVTERELRPASDALRKVEAGFRAVTPQLPPHIDLLLSVQVRGISRVYAQMFTFQPPRVWYRDVTMRVMKPINVKPSDRPVALALIGSDLDVGFLNAVTFDYRSASGRQLDYYGGEKALRGLAIGLGGAGYADRGSSILLKIPNPTPTLASAHIRLAAMLQLAAGQQARAESLLRLAPPLSRQQAMNDLKVVLAEQPSGASYDDFALWAFGVPSDDYSTFRELATWLVELAYAEPARRMAGRMLMLQPRDSVALRTIAVADSIIEDRRRWPEEMR